MSEFTAGVLYRTADAAAVDALLAHVKLVHRCHRLNPQWDLFVTPDEWLTSITTVRALRQISWAAPLLYFNNAEDHGWSYRIFAQGRGCGEFMVDYEQNNWTVCQPDAFAVFGLAPSQVADVQCVLTTDWRLKDDVRESAAAFKHAIGAPEMEWISYRYLDHSQQVR